MTRSPYLAAATCAALLLLVSGCEKSPEETEPVVEAQPTEPAPPAAETPAAMPEPSAETAEPAPAPAPSTSTPAPASQPQIQIQPSDEVVEFMQEVQKGLNMALTIKAAVDEAYGKRGVIPQTMEEAGVSTRSVSPEGEVQSVDLQSGVIVIDYGDDKGTIEMSPSPEGDTLVWDCTGGTLDAEYRPEECRAKP